MQLAGRQVILGVCGSIAAYKSVLLLRLLQQEGADVHVALTPDAERFVGRLTLASLSQNPVFDNLWDTTHSWSRHVHLARQAQLLIVAPTTANTLAKLAHGLCDNAVTALALSATCPLLVCPAMDHEMYEHPATQANIAVLRERGCHILEPHTGYLASGLQGSGRLAEPEDILKQAILLLGHKPLAGKHILLTAGPTQEHLDPVRYISNHSTGKMGIAVAQAAYNMGATVTLVAGPLQVPVPASIEHIQVKTAQQMLEAVQKASSQADACILTAAVSDYAPTHAAPEKIKKKGEAITLELSKTPDILAWLGQNKRPDQLLVGFALETGDGLDYAREKLKRKNCDMVVMNTLQDPGAGFGHDTNVITIIDKNGLEVRYPQKSKQELAYDILNHLLSISPAQA